MASAGLRTGHARRHALALLASMRRTRSTAADTETAYVNRAPQAGAVNQPVPPDVRDYSLHSGPLKGILFEKQPTTRAEMAPFMLTPEQVAAYWRDGFVANIPVLSHAQCDRICDEIGAFLQPTLHPGHGLFHEFHRNQSGDAGNVLMHCLGHWRIQPCLHELIYHPAIAVPSAQLIDPHAPLAPVRFWHDQLFVKPPRHGGNVAFHQDYSYWTRTVPMQHLTVHLALDSQYPVNGAITYIPGSHRWHRDGRPLPITDENFADMDSIKKVLRPEELAEFKPVTLTLMRGEAVLHHPLCVHGSYGNRSEFPRRAAVVNYFRDGTLSDSDEPVLAGTPAIPKGRPMEGRFHPVVFDPASIKG